MQIKKRRYIQFALALVALAIIGGTMLVNSPRVQQRVSVLLATELENRIGTRVNLGGVHWLFPSDIVIDSLCIDDQEGEHLLSVNRIAAKVEWMPLIRHRQLSVRNIRLFHPDINIYRTHAEEDYNYQFLIDAFASKKERKEPPRLSLRINTLLVRQGKLRVESGKWKEEPKVDARRNRSQSDHPDRNNSQLSSLNFQLENLAAQLSLKTLSADSISLITRHLGFKERSGLQVDDLYFRLVGNRQGATLANFQLDLPHSSLQLDTVWASFPVGNPQTTGEPQTPLIVKGKIRPSHLTPADLGALLPEVAGITEKIHFDADFIGSPSRINLKALNIHSAHRDLVLQAEAKLSIQNKGIPAITLDLHEAAVTDGVWTLLQKQSPEIYGLIPQEIVRIGSATAMGDLRHDTGQTTLDLQATTDAGNLRTYIELDSQGNYTATLDGEGIEVAQIVPESPLERTNITLQTQGLVEFKSENPKLKVINSTDHDKVKSHQLAGDNFQFSILNSQFTATATHAHLLGYEYGSISLNGNYTPGHYEATLALDDPNGTVLLDATYHAEGHMPRYTATLRADSLDLHAMQLIDIHEGNTFSARLTAGIEGYDIDQMTGEITIDSLTMHRPSGDYLIQEIDLYSNEQSPDFKTLSLHTDFMDGSLSGNFTYESLANSFLNQLHHYLPSLCHSHDHNHIVASENLCTASFRIYDTRPLRELLLIPVDIDKTASIETLINDHTETFSLTLNIPHLEYDGNVVKGISLNCQPQGEGLTLLMGGTLQSDPTTAINANIMAHALNDNISLGTSWNSNAAGMFEGFFNTQAHFGRNDKGDYAITVASDSSRAVINQSAWQLAPFKLSVEPDEITVQDLHFAHDESQYLSIDGTVAHNDADTLQVKLNNLDLGYLLSLVGLKGISFDGIVSGYINAANLYTPTPYLDATLQTQDFTFCNGPMGDMQATAQWNQDSTRLEFTAQLGETPQHTSVVDGIVDLNRNELWLDIAADSLNASFLNSMLSSFMSDITGNATGNLTVGGPLDAIDLDGALMGDLTFNLTPTNVNYHLKDSIRFSPGIINLSGIEVFDRRGQKAIVTGNITHDKLSNYAYDIHIDPQNFLGIDLPDTGNDSFYTTIYGTGAVHVTGSPTTPLTIGVQAHPEKGSLFALNLASQAVSSSDAFITFTDRSAKRNVATGNTRPTTPRRRTNSEATTLNLDIAATITPDATLKLVMNQAVDDHISATGNGDLQISVHGDDINLFGTYTVDRGFYRLSLQDVINKNFDVISGSTVTFDGDPMNARLNITARHTVNYVPLKDLSPELTGEVHVNSLLRIGGTLNAPEITFDLELPKGTEEEKSILRSYTSTEEQMNLQFIYLLGLGKFYTPDMTQNNEGTNNMESFLSTTISGQINNILSNIISNNNWNFASNIRTENMLTGENDINGENWENMEIEGILEGHLLDNRLLINGNFGYRENPMYASNFIGDFDVRYLLTNGLSLKGYNKTNDRYFTKTALTTQGIGLVLQRDFDYLFPWWRKKMRHATPTANAVTAPVDTVFTTLPDSTITR